MGPEKSVLWTVGVFPFLIRILMMGPVGCDPGERSRLTGEGSQEGGGISHDLVGLETAVGKEPMVAEGNADGPGQVIEK